MPLQVMPHAFSSKHPWQMANPHRQRQQKRKTSPQQWHSKLFARRRPNSLFDSFIFQPETEYGQGLLVV
jgi:hypothetical protein